MIRKTKDAARELGLPVSRIQSFLRMERMPLPQKDSSGDYVWTDKDMANARAAMKKPRRRPAKLN